MKTIATSFTDQMVQVLPPGPKSQTRRIMAIQPPDDSYTLSMCVSTTGDKRNEGRHHWIKMDDNKVIDGSQPYFSCPYGKINDRLAVKEAAWMWCEKIPDGLTKRGRPKFRYAALAGPKIYYCADDPTKPTEVPFQPLTSKTWLWRWKRGRFLPWWAVRKYLKVARIGIERLHDISAEDAIAEGIECVTSIGPMRAMGWRDYSGGQGFFSPIDSYRTLWELINGAGSWALNPWVWVVTFKEG